MNKPLLYILLIFSSAVIADWTTIKYDFNMCNQVNDATLHVNDDGSTYSTSPLVRSIQTLKNEPTEATYNVTMWGCTHDYNFNLVVKLNKVDRSVSVLTDDKVQNDVCEASGYRQIQRNLISTPNVTFTGSQQYLISTPKVTYTGATPNQEDAFPADLTAKYCSKGVHPDAPNWPIEPTDDIHTCVDRLTGRQDGTYTAALNYGTGFPTDKIIEAIGVATYNLVVAENKASQQQTPKKVS